MKKPHNAFKDLSGQKFNRWTVIDYAGTSGYGATWNCICECGNKKVVRTTSLKNGKSKSCGCLHSEITKARAKHGHNRDAGRSPTYQSWRDMLRRCNDERHRNYATYGGKGIKVCKSWHKFENFLEDLGERPEGKTLDRIDSNKDYKPSNCRWATPKEQANNMSRNRILEYKGEKHTMSEWADITGIKYVTLNTRIHRGWSVERALTTK